MAIFVNIKRTGSFYLITLKCSLRGPRFEGRRGLQKERIRHLRRQLEKGSDKSHQPSEKERSKMVDRLASTTAAVDHSGDTIKQHPANNSSKTITKKTPAEKQR